MIIASFVLGVYAMILALLPSFALSAAMPLSLIGGICGWCALRQRKRASTRTREAKIVITLNMVAFIFSLCWVLFFIVMRIRLL